MFYIMSLMFPKICSFMKYNNTKEVGKEKKKERKNKNVDE